MSSTDLSSNPSEPHASGNDNRNDNNGLGGGDDATLMPLIVYILYLVGLLNGITSVVGVVIAYIYQPQAPTWLKAHYRYQIRTFWIGLLYGFIAFLLTFILIGWILFALIVVWMIIRSIKGIQALQNKTAPANIESWSF